MQEWKAPEYQILLQFLERVPTTGEIEQDNITHIRRKLKANLTELMQQAKPPSPPAKKKAARQPRAKK